MPRKPFHKTSNEQAAVVSSQTVLQLLQPDFKLSDVFAIFPLPIVKGEKVNVEGIWDEIPCWFFPVGIGDGDDVDDVLAGGKWLSGWQELSKETGEVETGFLRYFSSKHFYFYWI